MEADYSVELGPAAPALEIPWKDPEGRLHYFDLRRRPDCIEQIPEARQFPALRRLLIEVNSPPGTWQTAKCDVWQDEAEAAGNLYEAGFEQGCYVDLVLAEQAAAWRRSLEVHQLAAKEMAQMLGANEALEAFAEIIVRRCYFHGGGDMDESDAGYCLTLFLTGYGATPAKAAVCWDGAMEFAAGCVQRWQPREGRAQAGELS
jgi:hypothetical protein